MGAALRWARRALGRVVGALWLHRSVAERIALLTLIAAVLAVIPAYARLENDDDNRPPPANDADDDSSEAGEAQSDDAHIDSPTTSAPSVPDDIVSDRGERESSPWPDVDTVFLRGGGSDSAFDDLASVAAGSIDDDSIEYLQVRSADGNYCERFENVTVDSLFLVPMGIGYSMLVTYIGVVSDATIVFRPPADDVRNTPRGIPCNS